MKIKFGALVVAGSGKLGGHVATKNKQGYALRTKVTPTNRRTTTQQNQKSTFSSDSSAWASLTQTQRDAWNSAAGNTRKTNIFGDKYAPTGKNYYMLINQGLQLVGAAVVNDPPATTPATALTAFGIASNTVAAQTLSFAATPVPAGMKVVIQATRPLSAGVSSAGKQFRNVTTVAAAAASPANTFAAYSAKFGTPVSGKKIFFQAFVVNITTGQRSLPLQASSITA